MPELIDKDALRYIESDKDAYTGDWNDDYEKGFRDALNKALELPTIEPEVQHGHWIAVSSFDACGGDEEAWMAHGNPIAYHYCSECKNETYLNEEGKEIISDYCPFCGADMRDGGADNG